MASKYWAPKNFEQGNTRGCLKQSSLVESSFMSHENQKHIDNICLYYEATCDAFARWGGDGGFIHFGFHPNPEFPIDHFESLKLMTSKIIQLADIRQGQTVLDAGCGVGGVLLEIAKTEGVAAYGINVSQPQIVAAQGRISKASLTERVCVIQQDYTSTQFASNFFDRTIMIESLFHAQEKGEVLAEMRRILKEDSPLVISDYFLQTELDRKALQNLRVFENGWCGRVVTVNEVVQAMRDAGFRSTESINCTRNVLPSVALAAKSAQNHKGEQAAQGRQNHRLATQKLYDLMKGGRMGYFILKAA
jgi:cyclopropane fatty-acyl-phospholipid synthase-like methyltransferase